MNINTGIPGKDPDIVDGVGYFFFRQMFNQHIAVRMALFPPLQGRGHIEDAFSWHLFVDMQYQTGGHFNIFNMANG